VVGAGVAAVVVSCRSGVGHLWWGPGGRVEFPHVAFEAGDRGVEGVAGGRGGVARRRVFLAVFGCDGERGGPELRSSRQLQGPCEFGGVRDVPLDRVEHAVGVEVDGVGEASGLPVAFGVGHPGDDRGRFLQGVEAFFDAPLAGADPGAPVVGDVVDDEVGQRPAPGEGVGESGGPVVGEDLGGVLPWGAG
jgi:hypothetical protein